MPYKVHRKLAGSTQDIESIGKILVLLATLVLSLFLFLSCCVIFILLPIMDTVVNRKAKGVFFSLFVILCHFHFIAYNGYNGYWEMKRGRKV